MFSRYTERAQRVIVLAQDESRRLAFNYVAPEHLLLGVLREGEGIGVRAMQALGWDLAALRAAVEAELGRGPLKRPQSGEIGFTPPAKQVMVEAAVEETRRLGQNYVGTEHILLGLVRRAEGKLADVLGRFGITAEALEAKVREMLGAAPGPARLAGETAAGPARLAGETAPAPPPGRDRMPPPSRYVSLLPLSELTRRVLLPLASFEAARAGANAIAPEHLLLAMLRDGDPSLAARVLQEKGITLEWLRQRLQQG